MAGNYTVPYAGQPFDWTGGANDSIVRLMMEQGRIAADRAQRSGEIWGNAIQNIGNIAGSTIEKVQEQKQKDAMAKRDVAWVSFLGSPDAEDEKKVLAQAVRLYGGHDGPKMAEGVNAATRLHAESARKDQDAALKDFGLMIGAGDVPDTGARAHLWPVLHAAALKNPEALARIGLTPDQIPAEYPGDEAWQSTISPLGKILRGEQQKPAEGFTLSPGQERHDASGKIIAKAEPAPPKGPEAGTFEAALLQKYGPQPTPEQTLQFRAQWQAAGREPKDTSYQDEGQRQRSYQFNAGQIEKIEKPVRDQLDRFSRLADTVNQGTGQADALVAPELLSVMAGGSGSGLRMNEAEIKRIVGGRSTIEGFKAMLKKVADGGSITDEQRGQIKALMGAVQGKLQARADLFDQANQALVGAKTAKEHEQIVADLKSKLNAANTVEDKRELTYNPATGKLE